MGAVTVVWVIVAIAFAGVAVILSMTLWQLRKTMKNLDVHLVETLRQVNETAEDIRRTNESVRGIISSVERSAANIEHVTEGVRGFRSTLDAATSVLKFAVVPVLGNAAAGIAGVKAGLSHVMNRWFRKEEAHE